MTILSRLMEKPWENPGLPDLAAAGRGPRLPAAAVALRLFICVVSILFSLLIAAYAARMEMVDWRPTPQQWLLWLNTALLVVSSVAFQWASVSIRQGRLEDAKAGLVAAGAFALGFLLGQYLAWRQLSGFMLFSVRDPAIAFFYLITALHALHLVGGLVAWGRTTVDLWRRPDPAGAAQAVRLCAAYWHFLLVIWLVLFGLLFSGNDNLAFVLALCGLR